MRTTPEQRATMRAALADETYADLNRDEVRDVLALLDDLDEALAELAALRYGLDGAMECIRRVRQAMAEKVDTDVVLAVRRVVAELAALRAVAEAARAYCGDPEQRHLDADAALDALRAALRAWEERER